MNGYQDHGNNANEPEFEEDEDWKLEEEFQDELQDRMHTHNAACTTHFGAFRANSRAHAYTEYCRKKKYIYKHIQYKHAYLRYFKLDISRYIEKEHRNNME